MIRNTALQQAIHKIKSSTSPITIRLYKKNVGDKGMQILVDNFIHLKTSLTIYITDNNIGDKGMQALANILIYLKFPLTIYIDSNHIGDEGIQAFANNLHHLKIPLIIYLDDNKIGDKGMQTLADSLPYLKVAFAIYLNSNSIGDKGTQALANTLIHLKFPLTIDLRHNSITNDGAQSLVNNFINLKIPLTIYLIGNEIEDKIQDLITMSIQDNIAILSNENHKQTTKLQQHITHHMCNLVYPHDLKINTDVMSIIVNYLSQEQIIWYGLQLIHNANAAIDNNYYTLNDHILSIYIKNNFLPINKVSYYTKLYQFWLSCTKQLDRFILDHIVTLEMIDQNKNKRMTQLAKDYGYKINTNNLSTKKLYFEYAKSFHPDKGGEEKHFIKLDIIYREDHQTTLKSLMSTTQNNIQHINIISKTLDITTDSIRIVHHLKANHYVIDNAVIHDSMMLTKNLMLLLGRSYKFEGNAQLMLVAPIIDIIPKLYEGNMMEVFDAMTHSTSYIIALSLAYGSSPTLALLIESGLMIMNIYQSGTNLYNLYEEIYNDNESCEEHYTQGQHSNALIPSDENIII